MKKRAYFGLSVKVIIAVSSIIIFTSIILSWFFITRQSLFLKNFIENRIIILANSVASSSLFAVSSYPQGSSSEFLYHLGKSGLREENVMYLEIYDVNGTLLTSQSVVDENITEYLKSTPVDSSTIQSLKDTKIQKYTNNILKVGKILDIVVPIVDIDFSKYKSSKEVVVGVVRIGASLDEIKHQIEKMIKNVVLITLIAIFIGVFLSFFIIKITVGYIRKEDFILERKK